MTTVSIITPSFNQGQFVEETIQSVLGQDVQQLQYIVMDGGSEDETLSLLKKYQHRLQWISEKDQGQAHAVNKGFKMATGEIIGWLNSDDIYYPHAIKRVCDFFAEHPEMDVLYGKTCQLDSIGDHVLGVYPTEAWDIEKLKVCCFISQPATFFRKKAITQYGLLDESLQFCLDYEYWLRLGLQGAHFAYLPEILSGARIYPEAKSTRYYLEAHFETINMLQRTLGYIPSEWLVNYSTAKVKTESPFSYPHPRFIFSAWLNLWKMSGLHNHGLRRITTWLSAQQRMLKKFFIKIFHSPASFLSKEGDF